MQNGDWLLETGAKDISKQESAATKDIKTISAWIGNLLFQDCKRLDLQLAELLADIAVSFR